MPSPGVTISGTIVDLEGNPSAGRIDFLLENYGNEPPLIDGTAMLAPIDAVVHAASNGTFSVTIWGNYQIDPVQTFYTLTIFTPDGGFVSCASYLFNTAGAFNLASLTPLFDFAGFVVEKGPQGPQGLKGDTGATGPGGGLNVVPFTTTPVFDLSKGQMQQITLTGNVTSSTVTNGVAGLAYTFLIIQDATGGRAFTWPTNFFGGVDVSFNNTANASNLQTFVYDGTNLYATSGAMGY